MQLISGPQHHGQKSAGGPPPHLTPADYNNKIKEFLLNSYISDKFYTGCCLSLWNGSITLLYYTVVPQLQEALCIEFFAEKKLIINKKKENLMYIFCSWGNNICILGKVCFLQLGQNEEELILPSFQLVVKSCANYISVVGTNSRRDWAGFECKFVLR